MKVLNKIIERVNDENRFNKLNNYFDKKLKNKVTLFYKQLAKTKESIWNSLSSEYHNLGKILENDKYRNDEFILEFTKNISDTSYTVTSDINNKVFVIVNISETFGEVLKSGEFDKVEGFVNTEIRNVFVHETTHVIDEIDIDWKDKKYDKAMDNGDKVYYFNSGKEKTAYLLGLLSELDLKSMSFQDVIKSENISLYLGNLTEKNKKSVINRMYDIWNNQNKEQTYELFTSSFPKDKKSDMKLYNLIDKYIKDKNESLFISPNGALKFVASKKYDNKKNITYSIVSQPMVKNIEKFRASVNYINSNYVSFEHGTKIYSLDYINSLNTINLTADDFK